jgi:hypothetical protein
MNGLQMIEQVVADIVIFAMNDNIHINPIHWLQWL